VFVFGELQGRSGFLYMQVIGGSLIMAAGAAAIAFSSAPPKEYERWQSAAFRESERYGTDPDYVRAALEGHGNQPSRRRTPLDWTMLIITTVIFLVLAVISAPPMVAFNFRAAAALLLIIVGILVISALSLWQTTRFN
jgi:hypothetical protein